MAASCPDVAPLEINPTAKKDNYIANMTPLFLILYPCLIGKLLQPALMSWWVCRLAFHTFHLFHVAFHGKITTFPAADFQTSSRTAADASATCCLPGSMDLHVWNTSQKILVKFLDYQMRTK